MVVNWQSGRDVVHFDEDGIYVINREGAKSHVFQIRGIYAISQIENSVVALRKSDGGCEIIEFGRSPVVRMRDRMVSSVSTYGPNGIIVNEDDSLYKLSWGYGSLVYHFPSILAIQAVDECTCYFSTKEDGILLYNRDGEHPLRQVVTDCNVKAFEIYDAPDGMQYICYSTERSTMVKCINTNKIVYYIPKGYERVVFRGDTLFMFGSDVKIESYI